MENDINPTLSKKDRIINLAKENVVLIIAILAAIITSFISPPDAEYHNYFDFKTLSCLFCVLAVV